MNATSSEKTYHFGGVEKHSVLTDCAVVQSGGSVCGPWLREKTQTSTNSQV